MSCIVTSQSGKLNSRQANDKDINVIHIRITKWSWATIEAKYLILYERYV